MSRRLVWLMFSSWPLVDEAAITTAVPSHTTLEAAVPEVFLSERMLT
jgi:hypothetical protein